MRMTGEDKEPSPVFKTKQKKCLDFSSLMNILINKQTKAPDTAGVCFCYMWVWDQQVKIVKNDHLNIDIEGVYH